MSVCLRARTEEFHAESVNLIAPSDDTDDGHPITAALAALLAGAERHAARRNNRLPTSTGSALDYPTPSTGTGLFHDS